MHDILRRYCKLTLYSLSFIALGFIAVLFVLRVLDHGKSVDVPSVVGKSVIEATNLLRDKGLNLKIDGEDYDLQVPAGYIARQDILPGQKVKEGRNIRVFLSKGPMLVSTPAVEGESLDKAKLILSKAGLRIGRISRVHSDTVEKDVVIAQRPQAGEPGWGIVNLLVSLGPYEVFYKCPSFTDRSLEDARALAQSLGLRLLEKGKGDKILSQKPDAGSIIKKGATVEITIGEETKEW